MSRYRSWLCVCAWTWTWLLLAPLGPVGALQHRQLFDFGEAAGDRQLPAGSDASAELRLNGTLRLFKESYRSVHINTNGFVALAPPPPEDEYLGKSPASFPMVAALLGDLDSGDGRGRVYFREDDSADVLRRAAQHIREAFPRDDGQRLSSVLVVTWDNMAARGAAGRGDGLDAERNTFQLVVALSESSSIAILLYPSEGLRFLSTSLGGQRKPLEVSFNQGSVRGWFGRVTQGTYYRATTEDESSVRELTEKTNSGQRGVWVYEIGSTSYLFSIIPGMVSSVKEEAEASEPPPTLLPRQPGEGQDEDLSTYETLTTAEAVTEGGWPFPTETPTKSPTSSGEVQTSTPRRSHPKTPEPEREPEQFESEYHEAETITPTPTNPGPATTRAPEHPAPTSPHQAGTASEPRYNLPQPTSVPVRPSYPEPARPVPPRSQPQYPQVVVVEEDEDLNVNVFSYNLETCAHNRQRCSAFADCRDYSDGYCCHCKPGFYGNGKDCVAEGKPQRMNGKVSGRVLVGPSVHQFSNNDLHSYVVANDGRAYVAISNISRNLGPSLLPLSSLGGIIGWAFALEQPGFQNGFSLIGGVFSRQAEVIFQPGNERLIIKQQFGGIDEHEHLLVSTHLEGRVPFVPQGSTVQINPYKEIYQYDQNLIVSSSNRDYIVTSTVGNVQIRSFQWRQTITFQSCAHDPAAGAAPSTQQLSVDQIFVMFDDVNGLIRYAMSNKIGSVHNGPPEQNPCFTGRHGCDINAACIPGDGLHFTCKCTAGFTGDGRYCQDEDECRQTPPPCGSNAVCSNLQGSFRCECRSGFLLGSDGRTCVEENRPVNHCERGTHDCDSPDRASCTYSGGSAYVCSCLQGFVGNGRACRDVDECQRDRCHRDASCTNTQGSFTCQCQPGFHGDGFHCTPMPSEREKTPCERQRESAESAGPAPTSSSSFFSFFRPRAAPAVAPYVAQCDERGAFSPTQCHAALDQCWCVDANGLELPDTRRAASSAPLCIDQTVTPAPVGPTPRPDVLPAAAGTYLLLAQSGRIERIPLDGTAMKKEEAKPLLHIPDCVVIAVAYDCVEKMVYWSDITGPAISKAALSGGDVIPVISTGLQSPEGVAIDHISRLLFWTDSMRDTVEVSQLDGSQRRVLFDTDLVNPRPIVTNPAYGRLYWADWDRDGPKIEMSNMDGTERVVLVKEDLGLPNGLTFDSESQQLCWADAGTRRLECMDPHRRLRRRVQDQIQYPFALVAHGRSLYYTDWRREAVVAVDRHTETETEEFLPQKRSRLYGIAVVTEQCPQGYNYCANNGGCSHLCLPRLGGFTCRCPDAAAAAAGSRPCVERNL